MNLTTTAIDQSDEEIRLYEVSDEALEAVACAGKANGNYTLADCSGLSVCPA